MKSAGDIVLKLLGTLLAIVIVLIVLSGCAVGIPVDETEMVTSRHEILEPQTWAGKRLPILEHIDISKQLEKGTWLVLLYHHDCPDCGKTIPMYEQMADDLKGNEDFLQIALIEVPPYGPASLSENLPCSMGRLPDTKEWFITTPATALITDGKVKKAWEEKAPDFDIILENIVSTNPVSISLHRKEVMLMRK